MARKPWWVATKNKMVPAAPATPVIAASSRARPPHSRKLRTATAATSPAARSPPAPARAPPHPPPPPRARRHRPQAASRAGPVQPDEQQREERPRDQPVPDP